MDPKSYEEEHKQDDETPPDSKTLVTALTHQLNQSHLDEVRRAQPRARASMDATASLVTTAPNVDNTGNSSLNVNDNVFRDQVEESFPLPDFLSETHLRATLHRAVNAHSQEAISDEAPPHSFFPQLRTLVCPGFPSFNVACSAPLPLFSCSSALSGASFRILKSLPDLSQAMSRNRC
jgi:hypothetical protein